MTVGPCWAVTALASSYADLLQRGTARIQCVAVAGDNLPRDPEGRLLGVKQEIATDVAERTNGWPSDVYVAGGGNLVRNPGYDPRRSWGATNEGHLVAWVPSSDAPSAPAVTAARGYYGATDSRYASEIASCGGLDLHDDGDIWRDAVDRGRALRGDSGALDSCARRAPDGLTVAFEGYPTTEYDVQPDGPDGLVVTAPIRPGFSDSDFSESLYAVARGTLAMHSGPPLTLDEKALDALAASFVTARGTNGAGLGWNPPEPDLLRHAGRVLARSPDRLDDVVQRVHSVQQVLYPPWPDRELRHEREDPSKEIADELQESPQQELAGRSRDADVFDRVRARYREDRREWARSPDSSSRQPSAPTPSVPRPLQPPAPKPSPSPARESDRVPDRNSGRSR